MSAMVEMTRKTIERGYVPVSHNSRYLPNLPQRNGHIEPLSRRVPQCDTPGRLESVTFADQTLIHGDFFDNNLETHGVDLILTDPPYGCLTDVLPWDVPIDQDLLTAEFDRILKPTGQLAVFASFRSGAELWQSMRKKFSFRYNHVWQKSGQPVNLMQPIFDHELILVFKKRKTRTRDLTFNPEAVATPGQPYVKPNYILGNPTRKTRKSPMSVNKTGRRFPKCIIKAPSKPNMTLEERTAHPTQKPVFLMSYLVKLLSNPGDLVCDPFAGSASTLVACHGHNRQGVGFEISGEYYTAACERLKNITAQERLAF